VVREPNVDDLRSADPSAQVPRPAGPEAQRDGEADVIESDDVVDVRHERRPQQRLEPAGDVARAVRRSEQDELRRVLPDELRQNVRGRLGRIVLEDGVVAGQHARRTVLAEDARRSEGSGSERDGGDVHGERPRLRQELKRRAIDIAPRPELRVDPGAGHG
jgi:hypothetical protein